MESFFYFLIVRLVTKTRIAAIALSGAAVSPAMAQYPGGYPASAPAPGANPYYPGSALAPVSTSLICGRVGSDPATLVQVYDRSF